MSREQVLALALALSPEERVALAAELFDSLGPDDPNAAEAWDQTIARRVAELARGEVTTIPGEQVCEAALPLILYRKG